MTVKNGGKTFLLSLIYEYYHIITSAGCPAPPRESSSVAHALH
jgi:hypothetical protein